MVNVLSDLGQWIWDFWMWCAAINLFFMVVADVARNTWSPPRDYASVVGLGPVSLSLIIYTVGLNVVVAYRIVRKKRKG